MTTAKKGRKTGAKKRKFPLPGKEPRAVFSTALAIAKDLLKSDALSINLDPNGSVDLLIDTEKLEAVPKEKFKQGLTHEQFSNLIRTELDSLVEAATYSDPTAGIQITIPSAILEQVGIDEFLWRLGEVKKELVPADLRDRATFRRTTQGLVLENMTWQLGIKKHDQVKGELSDIPYASLSIVYAAPQTNVSSVRLKAKGMSMEFPTLREPKQLMLELHQADVEQMIETLTDLRDNLEKLKKGK
ncbi:MAG: hypothetical protein KAV87_22600 [Desulfobacteraceae bacterium]|nr:hypothetical protein [Desulfobacteraceae bacterium]